MKKIIMYVLIIVSIIISIIFIQIITTPKNQSSEFTLTIYNWGDYIDPELLEKFKEETGYKVVYETFDSNEAMYLKIKNNSSSYDIAVPSDYMVQKMIQEKLVNKIDKTLLTGLEDINPLFLNQSFDPNNDYSIPYFWGTVGIIYNPEMTDLNIASFNDLWHPSLKNNILLVDGAREVMGMSLNSMSYSLNSLNDDELKQALYKLESLQPNVKAIVGDEIKMLMANNEAAAALVWSGDASEIISENDKLEYVIPNEGTNVYLDNLVIPKTSKNKKAAYEFLNFMLRAENAAQNAEYVGYSTPITKALDLMDKDIVSDERFYPNMDTLPPLEYYKNLGKEGLLKYNDLFLEFKMFRK